MSRYVIILLNYKFEITQKDDVVVEEDDDDDDDS
jgi:hypothetical protein